MENSNVTIVEAEVLKTCRLEDLIGRTGNIVDICYNKEGKVRGCWIELEGEPYLDEKEWFIPAEALKFTKCLDANE